MRTRAPQLPASLLVFGDGTDAGNQQTPLSLLADVAASARDATSNQGTADNLMRNSHSGLHAMGPFNPIVLLPAKVSKKILDLEFVEMNEISSDDPPPVIPGHPPLPPMETHPGHLPLGRKVLCYGGCTDYQVPRESPRVAGLPGLYSQSRKEL